MSGMQTHEDFTMSKEEPATDPQPEVNYGRIPASEAAELSDTLALLKECKPALVELLALHKAGVLAALARQHGVF